MGSNVQTLAALVSGGLQARALREEERETKKQANLTVEESRREAERIRLTGEQTQAKQKLAFLKSGVSLQGSPLLTLAGTKEEFATRAESVESKAISQRRLGRSKAKILRGRGRAAIISGISQASTAQIAGAPPRG